MASWCRGSFPTFMTPAELSKCGLVVDTSYVSQVALQYLKPNETHLEFYKRMFNITRLILKTIGPASGNVMFVGHAATLEACTRQLVGAQPRTAQTGADQDCPEDPLMWTLCVSGERVWKEQHLGLYRSSHPTSHSCTKLTSDLIGDACSDC